jgi:hypothetical protein
MNAAAEGGALHHFNHIGGQPMDFLSAVIIGEAIFGGDDDGNRQSGSNAKRASSAPARTPNRDLDEFRHTERMRDAAFMEEVERNMAESDAHVASAMDSMSPFLTEAGAEEYSLFIKKYIANGGKPTHSYNYPFPCRRVLNLFTAKQSFVARQLHGASSIVILAKDGIVIDGDLGHSTVLHENGRRQGHFCPIYLDT